MLTVVAPGERAGVLSLALGAARASPGALGRGRWSAVLAARCLHRWRHAGSGNLLRSALRRCLLSCYLLGRLPISLFLRSSGGRHGLASLLGSCGLLGAFLPLLGLQRLACLEALAAGLFLLIADALLLLRGNGGCTHVHHLRFHDGRGAVDVAGAPCGARLGRLDHQLRDVHLRPTRLAEVKLDGGGDQVISEPVQAQPRRHREREVADHERQKL
mmetsp:Transcript_706/g.2619  ORF Transcript_706/g.2619 Transcript_706/m.2619 type:complete len:216 (-) Transcript_706:1076-1723(-)